MNFFNYAMQTEDACSEAIKLASRRTRVRAVERLHVKPAELRKLNGETTGDFAVAPAGNGSCRFELYLEPNVECRSTEGLPYR